MNSLLEFLLVIGITAPFALYVCKRACEGKPVPAGTISAFASLFLALAALLAVLSGKGDGLWTSAVEPALEEAFGALLAKKL